MTEPEQATQQQIQANAEMGSASLFAVATSLEEARRIQRQIARLTAREAIHFLHDYPGPKDGDGIDQAVRHWVEDLLRKRVRATEFSVAPDTSAPPNVSPN